ncbi:MAG: acetyl esterase/lipase [Patiriisocius sp.]|jgi:acetyl esterase/lipase
MIDKELRVAGFFLSLMPASRRAFKLMHFFMDRQKGTDIDELQCDEVLVQRKKANSEIRVRTYRPKRSEGNLPGLLYLHGGGYLMGVPEMAHAQIEMFIKTRNCVVVAPDYRKSVDAPYPAALEDAYDTLLWMKNNAEKLGIRSDQIMIGGHSAGGGLTAATCLYARDQNEVKVAFQMPLYPMIDDRMTNESAVSNTAPVWNSKANEIGWGLYLKDYQQKGLAIPNYAAPSRTTDYSNLPPAVTFVGDLEPFRDETIEFVENLKKAGVPVQFELFEGCFHAFETVVPDAKVSKAANRLLTEAFAHAVDHYYAPQPESESE